jgi:hypothetical protein
VGEASRRLFIVGLLIGPGGVSIFLLIGVTPFPAKEPDRRPPRSRRVPRQRSVVVIVELRMSPRRSVQDQRYVSRELRRGSSQSFAVGIEREADVPLVV